jgi:hypothetical protein
MRIHDQGWRDLQQEPLTTAEKAIACVCVAVIAAYFLDLIVRVA